MGRPSYDPDAERATVAVLVYYGAEARDLTDTIGTEDFYQPICARVWDVCLSLIGQGEKVTLSALRDELPKEDPQALMDFVFQVVTLGEGRRAARIVAELAARRRLRRAAERLLAQAGDREVPVEDSVAEARESLAEAGMPIGSVPPGPDVAQFFEEITDEPNWVVPDVIEHEDRIILIAPEGAGKSVVLRQLCLQAAAGMVPFYDSKPMEPVKTMLVDGENSPAVVSRQLMPLYREAGAGLDPTRMTVHVRPAGIDLLSRADRRWLTERLAANRPDLLALGPLYRLHNLDPTEERPARTVAAVLDDLRARYGFALVIETHMPHAGGGSHKRPFRPYGASLWMRWPEVGIGLTREDDDEAGMWHLKSWRPPRDERRYPRRLFRGGRWPWMVSRPPSKPVPPKPSQSLIGEQF